MRDEMLLGRNSRARSLFSVERWWLKACFNVLIAIFIILVYLLAIALGGCDDHPTRINFSIIAKQ